jgi:hypothetical protein
MIGSKTMSKFHYEGKFAIAGYRIAKHPNTYPYYLSCYHGEKPQACRRSLKWRDIEYACAVVRSLLDSGIAGDALDDRSLRTVVELLDWHSDSVEGLVLCEAEKNQIKRLKRLLGDRRISLLVLPRHLRLPAAAGCGAHRGS